MRKPTKKTGGNGRKPPSTSPSIGRSKSAKTTPNVRNLPFRLQLAGAARFFARLSEEYTEATDGYRAKLYEFAARCYTIGLGYTRHLDEFAKFKEDPFWADVRQKPKEDKIMRAVLVFTMKARSAKLASSVTKTAKVLELMAAQHVKPNEVTKRLKAGGGILKMYAKLSPSRSDVGRVSDDLELLSPNAGDDDEDNGSEVDADEVEQEETDRPKANPSPKYNAGGSPREKEASSDDVLSESAPSPAKGNRSDPGSGRNPGDAQPKPLENSRFDVTKDLIVEVGRTDLEQILSASQRIVFVADVGDEDETGWRPVKAMSLEYIPQKSRSHPKLEQIADHDNLDDDDEDH